MNCVEVFVYVQKNFFIGCSLFSLCAYIYICVYNHYFFYQANNALKEKRREEEKKESEDIERSIGRTTVLP